MKVRRHLQFLNRPRRVADLVGQLVVSRSGHIDLSFGGVFSLASAEAELGPGLLLDRPVVLVLAWSRHASIAPRHRTWQLDAHGIARLGSVRQAFFWIISAAAWDVESLEFIDLVTDSEPGLLAEGH